MLCFIDRTQLCDVFVLHTFEMSHVDLMMWLQVKAGGQADLAKQVAAIFLEGEGLVVCV